MGFQNSQETPSDPQNKTEVDFKKHLKCAPQRLARKTREIVQTVPCKIVKKWTYVN